MLYIIGTDKTEDGFLLVKTNCRVKLELRVKLLEGEQILIRLTDSQLDALAQSNFMVLDI